MLMSYTGCIESHGAKTRFDLLKDTIFLCYERLYPWAFGRLDVPKPELNYTKTFAAVKNLALTSASVHFLDVGLLSEFPSLEIFTLIVDGPYSEELPWQQTSPFCLVTMEERSALAQRLDVWLDFQRLNRVVFGRFQEQFADHNASHELEPLTFEFSAKVLEVQHSL